MGQTVNLLLFSFGGSNPSAPTATQVASGGPNLAEDLCKASESLLSQLAEAKAPANWHPPICGNSSVDRALAFQAGGRGFESRFPLSCCFSSVVERILGKDEVPSSTLGSSSTRRQMALTDGARRHKAHNCLRSHQNQFDNCFWGPRKRGLKRRRARIQ